MSSSKTPSGLVDPRAIDTCRTPWPLRSSPRVYRNSASLLSSELATKANARCAPAESGVNVSRCLRSYLKRASSGLKRAVGGPKRSEGLPYRGPVGLSTILLTEAASLVLSDSEAVVLMALAKFNRAARNEYMQVSGTERTRTFQVSHIAICVLLTLLFFDNCKNLLRERSQFVSQGWDALSGVTTTMST